MQFSDCHEGCIVPTMLVDSVGAGEGEISVLTCPVRLKRLYDRNGLLSAAAGGTVGYSDGHGPYQ